MVAVRGIGEQSISVVFFSCLNVSLFVCLCINIDNDMNTRGNIKNETILLKLMAAVTKDAFKRVVYYEYIIALCSVYQRNYRFSILFIGYLVVDNRQVSASIRMMKVHHCLGN